MTVRKHKRTDSLTKYVVFSLTSLILFSVIMIVVFCIYQSVPDVLVSAFFGCFGGEILMCCLIKLLKLKTEKDTM